MVTPSHSPKGKALTSTKGRLTESVVCSELHANQHAEAAEMAARLTLGILVMLAQFCAKCFDLGYAFGADLVARCANQVEILFQNCNLPTLSSGQNASFENFDNGAHVDIADKFPGTARVSFIALARLVIYGLGDDSVFGNKTTEPLLKLKQNRQLIGAQRNPQTWAVTNPVGILLAVIGVDLNRAFAVKETAKFSKPEFIVHSCDYTTVGA